MPLPLPTNPVLSSTFDEIQATNGGTLAPTNNGATISVNRRGYYQEDCLPLTEKCRPTFVLEKNLTVIRKGPTAQPHLEMFPYEEGTDTVNDYASGYNNAIIDASFLGSKMPQSTNYYEFGPPLPVAIGVTNPTFLAGGINDISNTLGTASDNQDISIFYNSVKEIVKAGDTIVIPIDVTLTLEDWEIGDQLIIEHEYVDSFGATQKATARIQITITNQNPATTANYHYGYHWKKDAAGLYITNPFPSNVPPLVPMVNPESHIIGRVMSITGNFPQSGITDEDLYSVSLVQNKAIFETKFPKFSYRYKYEDGEYSVFGPWSEIAFIPGNFDYMPKKGYNLGMQNKLRSLNIKNWVPKNIPKDVVQVDILYKESNSPNVYTVSSHKKDDLPEGTATFNYWNSPGNGGSSGNYNIKSELIHKVVASNQMLRPWDNVPRRALAQDITANRLIFANYVQNFDLKDNVGAGGAVKATFLPSFETEDFSIDGYNYPGLPGKSLKSMRTYQLGVVYRDRYGRETPVLTSKSGSIKLPKENAKLKNRLSVELTNNPPYWAESYTFYIKETSNEYYNLAMDRWYDAEDGGIWLSFPSSERNKITDRTNLILKKQHDTHVFTDYDNKYKVLSIKDNAPTFIKTDNKYWGSLPMMLPPPGWGVGSGKPGGWDSGMFYNTGLPLPNRMFIDVYAEYWDQSSFNELTSMAGAQIRVVQSTGTATAYNSTTSDTTNKTRWYDIASISYIGSPPQTQEISTTVTGVTTTSQVEMTGQQEQLVRVSLEKAFGNDALFCEPADQLSLSRGLSLEVRTKLIKDKSEFQGRFFVKILRDANVELNIIQPQQETEDKYQVLFTKDLKYICAAHPGIQDWSNQAIGITGSLLGVNTNYIPVGVNTSVNTSLAIPAWADTGINDTLYGINVTDAHARLVSSLSDRHENKGASYVDSSNIEEYAPSSSALWPYGPGDASEGAWDNPDAILAFNKYLIGTGNTTAFTHNVWPPHGAVSGTFSMTNSSSGTNPATSIPMNNAILNKPIRDWPSYIVDKYNPYTLFNNEAIGTLHQASNGTYENRVLANIGASQTMKITPSTLADNPWTSIYGSLGSNNYMYGINTNHVPAIWGDQSDFINITPGNGQPLFDAATIEKLREDWYYLYDGRNSVDDSWPHASHDPDRWFIDKAGAAAGYSGNGIWDDGTNGYIDISFWAVGSSTNFNALTKEPIDLMRSNSSESGFTEAISTVGTQFRFKYDPDQIVYTITSSQQNKKRIYNYEAPQGQWGVWDNATATAVGGDGIGFNTPRPWTKNELGGTQAFVSDMFSSDRSLAGGSTYNTRIRWTLTLDKIIGAEGANKFHPLKNHVDATGKANVNRGYGKYEAGMQHSAPSVVGAGHVRPEKGGTPTGGNVEFFNLNSYWNASDNAGDSEVNQPIYLDNHTSSDPLAPVGQTWYAQNTNAYIGLHERGLNDTEIQIVTPYRGEERDVPMTNNPAIWETEPLEDVGLDIYYAASPTYPVNLTRYRDDGIGTLSGPDEQDIHGANWYDYSLRGEEVIKVGSVVSLINGPPSNIYPAGIAGVPVVCNVQGDTIWLTETDAALNCAFVKGGAQYDLVNGDKIRFTWRGEGTFYGVGRDEEYIDFIVDYALSGTCYKLQPNTHNYKRSLSYFNCWSYGTGVESNRMRDDYNAVTVDKGVKASMPLATPYEEERRASGLIFSGIYNSTSGVNEINQFIQAEPITKDLNPINGSIQKLFARDTDLIAFCENKVFKILANKDALFNAGGNSQLTGSNKVLGQTMPFSGEYGISTNPESFASESYRVYFTDKARGAVLRLSKDGLTPISDAGMRDWFKDNLRFATALIGSHDDRDDQYNLTIETADQDGIPKAYTLSYTEARRGWVSFKSFIQQSGISHKNIYYTTPSNNYGNKTTKDPWGVSYAVSGMGMGEMWQHSLDLIIKRLVTVATFNSSAAVITDNLVGTIIPGMVVEGDGIPIDTTLLAISGCNGVTCNITLSNNCHFAIDPVAPFGPITELTFTSPRNSFYDIPKHYSMLKVLFNGAQDTIKRFKTLDYEGTQAKLGKANPTNNYQLEGQTLGQIYYDNFAKLGWYAHSIETDMQGGEIPEFLNKENKWFNYIRSSNYGA